MLKHAEGSKIFHAQGSRESYERACGSARSSSVYKDMPVVPACSVFSPVSGQWSCPGL